MQNALEYLCILSSLFSLRPSFAKPAHHFRLDYSVRSLVNIRSRTGAMARKLKIAVSGLGRMGSRHALHLLESTPRADLIAVCDPDPKSRAWAEQHLAPYGVKIYSDFDEMLQIEDLEAVVIATITTVHAEQTIKAIEADKHVLCEKPLSTDVNVSQRVVDAARKRPHLKVM